MKHDGDARPERETSLSDGSPGKDSSGPVLIEACDWGFTHADREQPVFSGLNLRIEPGERVLLLGASGSGKSTLLAALAGVLEDEHAAESGQLLIGGVPVRQARGRAGLMQQDPETQVVLPRLGDDVAFGAENLGVDPAEIWTRVEKALNAVGLHKPLDSSTSALSGGQKQRLALAGILAMAPGLVLLDEPTANLDPDGVVQVRDAVLTALADRSATLVVVEHRVAQWQEHMDRVIVLGHGGRVVADGAPGAVFAEHRRELFDAGIWVPGAEKLLEDAGFGAWSAEAKGSEAALSTRELSVGRAASKFRAREEAGSKPVLTGVNMRVEAGNALALSGQNGAGKSTLALTLGGLLAPISGRVEASEALADGAAAEPIKWKAKQLVRRIGNVFQEPEHQFVTGSVRDELAYSLRHQDVSISEPEVDARVEEMLDALGLAEVAEVNPFTLSGGQKRRLSVASVLIASPPVLILDEPTFGQDSRTWRGLVVLLRAALKAGSAVVMVTHDRALIHAVGARELVVAGGAVADGTEPPGGPGTSGSSAPAGDPGLKRGVLWRANPLTKLVATLVLAFALAFTVDPVSAGVALVLQLALYPLGGVSWKTLFARSWFMVPIALLVAWTTAVASPNSGAMLFDWGFLSVSTGSLGLGIAMGLRTLAIALPAIVLAITTDPTDLATALSQKARLSARFVLGTLAAMRLLGLLVEEWETMTMARRARGVGAQGGVVSRVKAALGQALVLLVLSIRRASRLAVTMEAKGFGGGKRSWARTSRFGRADLFFGLAVLFVAAASVAAAVTTGAWRPVW
ncbi:ATP-binding cassette domain-containing protein [Haematomicrobium sanguinis]|uniref:ATP-binding cassette domain-containing protein n=1 Tax=Haematomicrobium sanguinis TaxID=479106 RepID=UPI00068DE05F|nr:ATP-binding cassette domain-containing protein [Haematomicrobium sanguinis]